MLNLISTLANIQANIVKPKSKSNLVPLKRKKCPRVYNQHFEEFSEAAQDKF